MSFCVFPASLCFIVFCFLPFGALCFVIFIAQNTVVKFIACCFFLVVSDIEDIEALKISVDLSGFLLLESKFLFFVLCFTLVVCFLI